jgi:hypothetical protein
MCSGADHFAETSARRRLGLLEEGIDVEVDVDRVGRREFLVYARRTGCSMNGLRAYESLTVVAEVGLAGSRWDWHGYIVDGELPPALTIELSE